MPPDRPWIPLGRTAASSLVDARLQLHWAVQPVASVGTTYLPAAADWSHTTLDWLDDVRALAGRALPLAGGARVALRAEDLTLLWLSAEGEATGSLALPGRTLADATSWVMATIAHETGAKPRALELGPYELPEHPVAQGAPFSAPREHLAELARWYADADLVLQPLARAPQASPVRVWPHHFDIATLFVLDPELGAEEGRTIGVGMTPGDTSYAEPYVYVTPYPAPEDAGVPELHIGGWHTEDWFGAVLAGSELASLAADRQRERFEGFVDSAIAAARTLLA